MANHKSTLKRIKQTAKRTERNRFYRTRIKNMSRDVNEAIEAGDVEKAQAAFKVVNKNFHKFVSKGILKKNTAARKVSRMNAAVKKLATASV
jgi:small subunit ribosomal protein S20